MSDPGNYSDFTYTLDSFDEVSRSNSRRQSAGGESVYPYNYRHSVGNSAYIHPSHFDHMAQNNVYPRNPKGVYGQDFRTSSMPTEIPYQDNKLEQITEAYKQSDPHMNLKKGFQNTAPSPNFKNVINDLSFCHPIMITSKDELLSTSSQTGAPYTVVASTSQKVKAEISLNDTEYVKTNEIPDDSNESVIDRAVIKIEKEKDIHNEDNKKEIDQEQNVKDKRSKEKGRNERKGAEKSGSDEVYDNIKQEPVSDHENGAGTSDKEKVEEASSSSTVIEDSDEIEEKIERKKTIKKRVLKKTLKKKQATSESNEVKQTKLPKPVLPTKKENFKCDVCAKVVHSQRALIKHKNLHTGEFKCKECNKIFNSEKSLQNHDKVHSGFVGNEKCNVCDKEFYDKSSLNKHTLSVHMGIKNFQCEHCNLSFFARKTYEEHVRVHTGERPFKCDRCPKTYKRISDLNHHLRLHKGEISLTCDKCGEGFRRSSELNRHLKTKHVDDDCDVLETKHVSKRFNWSCWCGLVFSTVRDLNEHLGKHLNNPKPPLTLPQDPVLTYQDKQELVNSIVQDLGTNLKGSDNDGKQSFLAKGPNLDKELNFPVTSTVPNISEVIDLYLRKNTVVSEPLDMSCTTTSDYNHVVKLGKQQTNNLVSVTNKFTAPVMDEVAESIREKRNRDNDKNSTKIDTGDEDTLDTDNQNFIDKVQLKPELEIDTDFVDGSHTDDDNFNDNKEKEDEEDDEYGGDTDIDENGLHDIDKSPESELGTEMVKVKVEVDIYGEEGPKDNIEQDPDFLPTSASSGRKRRRKAAVPRKAVIKRKKTKTEPSLDEVKEEIGDIKEEEDDTNSQNKRRKTKSKKDMKEKAKRVQIKREKKMKKDEELEKLAADGNVDVKTLKCLQCNKLFGSIISLQKHANLHKGTFTCETCGKCFVTKRSLQTHIDNHEGRKVNSAICNVCDKAFYDISSLNKHVKTVHMDFKPFPCPQCDRRFSENKTLREHLRVHTGERPFACEICGKTYKRASELNFHIRKHSGQNTITCPECGQGFMRLGLLRRHMTFKHDNDNPFKCFLCVKNFPTKSMLKDHQIQNHVRERKHVCEKCSARFYNRSKLKKHLRRKTDCMEHPVQVDGVYQCKFCSLDFYNKEERKKHVDEQHDYEKDIKPTFSCQVCSKIFNRAQALKIHLKIHYQVRDYKCTECDAAFIQKHHLKQHIATHTGIKKYQCPVCLRNFAHNATLYNHMKHH